MTKRLSSIRGSEQVETRYAKTVAKDEKRRLQTPIILKLLV